MNTYLRNNNSENLILFFCGWGMDETPFSILSCDADILFVYDYLNPKFEYDFSKYKKITLLAFSYGVYASSIAKLDSIKFDKKVAINGTLIPVDDKFGVPVRQFALTEKMDSKTVVKFRERLFGGEKAKEHFDLFEQNLPQRTAQSCTEELIGMKEYSPKISNLEMQFDKIYISNHDRCVPTRNQLNFWGSKKYSNIINLEAGHFPFYNYKSIEELL